MRRHHRLSSSAAFLMLALPIPAGAIQAAAQKTGEAASKAAPLTEEDKQILKEREVLENLELLQDLDKIRLLPLLAEQNKPAQAKVKAVKRAGKDDGTRKKSK